MNLFRWLFRTRLFSLVQIDLGVSLMLTCPRILLWISLNFIWDFFVL